jgi:hypothetical protein
MHPVFALCFGLYTISVDDGPPKKLGDSDPAGSFTEDPAALSAFQVTNPLYQGQVPAVHQHP